VREAGFMTTLELILKGAALIGLLYLAVAVVIWSEHRFGAPRRKR
jgi:hypothetical protein